MDMKQGFLAALAALNLFAVTAFAADAPVALAVDATEVSRGLLHARLHLPASPGPLTLFYPKWIPGEHSPSGPVNNVTGLKFSAHGKSRDQSSDLDRKSTRLNSSHPRLSRMPSSA